MNNLNKDSSKEQLLLLLIETFPDVEISKTGNAKKIMDFMESQRQATIVEKEKELIPKIECLVGYLEYFVKKRTDIQNKSDEIVSVIEEANEFLTRYSPPRHDSEQWHGINAPLKNEVFLGNSPSEDTVKGNV